MTVACHTLPNRVWINAQLLPADKENFLTYYHGDEYTFCYAPFMIELLRLIYATQYDVIEFLLDPGMVYYDIAEWQTSVGKSVMQHLLFPLAEKITQVEVIETIGSYRLYRWCTCLYPILQPTFHNAWQGIFDCYTRENLFLTPMHYVFDFHKKKTNFKSKLAPNDLSILYAMMPPHLAYELLMIAICDQTNAHPQIVEEMLSKYITMVSLPKIIAFICANSPKQRRSAIELSGNFKADK